MSNHSGFTDARETLVSMRGALVAILAGCYSPHPPSGAPCSNGSECPSPLVCVANRCVDQGAGLVPPDADPSCTCAGSNLTCANSATRCELGCADDSARCIEIVPSNGIDPSLAGAVSDPITIGGATTFDTDTGAITGALVRPAGTGVAAGVGFVVEGNLGVFVIHDLTVTTAGSIRFTGTNAIVMLVGVNATIDGKLDLSAGEAGAGGPGGGSGGTFSVAAGGCGGAHGVSDAASTDDTGGGGGAGGGEGATGGAVQTFAGGMGGVACITVTVEPLIGGGGGGGGGPGLATAGVGGGGGGAMQLTVLGHATIGAGAITAGGGGGQGGSGNGDGNGAAGSGGGGGGAILIEAIEIDLETDAVVAANGGGGGGAANAGTNGNAGQPGSASGTAATGGASGGDPATDGGAGGASAPPGVPPDETTTVGNAGGGGGGAGRIHLRTVNALAISGTISPGATVATATTR